MMDIEMVSYVDRETDFALQLLNCIPTYRIQIYGLRMFPKLLKELQSNSPLAPLGHNKGESRPGIP